MPPLPWKKAGFSRLVADHLNSAKQGGSLVVETGFPTSLVDLFVKNRDGIKRSSRKKKRNRSRRDTESLAGDSTIGDPFPLLSSCPASPAKSLISRGSFYTKAPSPIHRMAPSPTISRNPSLSCSPPVWETPRPSFSGSPVPGNEPVAPVCVGDTIGDDGKSVRAKKVFAGILKILFLVVLMLGKKQFAIGITVAAFLLHIMEFLGKCLCRLLKQFQYAHFSFRHFLEQVWCNLRSKNEIEPTCSMEEDPYTENQTDEDEVNSSFPDFSTVKETPISKTSADSLSPRGGGENRIAKDDAGSRSFQLRSETFGKLDHCRSLHMDWISRIIMDDTAEELETQRDSNKNNKIRSRKIKSKIMKLWISKRKQEEDPISNSDSDSDSDSDGEEEAADEKSLKNLSKGIKAKINQIIPNKLKILKKKQACQKINRSTIYEGSEEETNSQTIDNLYEQESLAEDDQILSLNNEDISEDISSSTSDESESDSEMEESPKKEETVFCEKETMWTMKRTSFVFLVPIILIGLEGGRFWAIVFTMICCSVFKLVKMSSKFFQLLVANL